MYKDHFVYAPSQWETTLHCNVVPHWLGAYTKWPWMWDCTWILSTPSSLKFQHLQPYPLPLTHCGLVTPFCNTILSQHWPWCCQATSHYLNQLERLRSEIPCPMITPTSDSHQIPSQNMTKSKLQILENCQKFKILQETLHATHLLKLLDKM